MCGIRLHALGGNNPDLGVKIEFRPARLCHLALALSGQRQHSKQRAVGIVEALSAATGPELVVVQVRVRDFLPMIAFGLSRSQGEVSSP